MSENKNEKGFLARNFGKAADKGVYMGIGAFATATGLEQGLSSSAGFAGVALVAGTIGALVLPLVSEQFKNKPKP